MQRLGYVAISLTLCGLLLSQAGCTDTALLTDNSTVAPATPGRLRTENLPPAEVVRMSLYVGDEMEKKGNIPDAVSQFENVLNTDPKNLHAARRLAVLYDRQGQLDKAEAEYRKVFLAMPRDADLLNDWGWHHYQGGNWKESENKLRAALQLKGDLPRARCNLGLAIGQQGRLDEAFQTFCDAGLSQAEAHCNIGILFWMHANTEGARKAFLSARQIEPGNRKVEMLLTELERSPSGPPAGGGNQPADPRAARPQPPDSNAHVPETGYPAAGSGQGIRMGGKIWVPVDGQGTPSYGNPGR